MIMTITDEMVLKAAEALEWKTTAKSYGWTREEFDIWWNKDHLENSQFYNGHHNISDQSV